MKLTWCVYVFLGCVCSQSQRFRATFMSFPMDDRNIFRHFFLSSLGQDANRRWKTLKLRTFTAPEHINTACKFRLLHFDATIGINWTGLSAVRQSWLKSFSQIPPSPPSRIFYSQCFPFTVASILEPSGFLAHELARGEEANVLPLRPPLALRVYIANIAFVGSRACSVGIFS